METKPSTTTAQLNAMGLGRPVQVVVANRTDSRVYEFIPAKYEAKTPQVIACVNILKSVVDPKTNKVTELKLRDAINKRSAELRTKQKPWLIFQYYRPSMVKIGFLKHN